MGEDSIDLLEDILSDDFEDDDSLETLPSGADITKLQAEVEALTKEKHGLLQGVKEERRKRQELSGKLSQLTETVNSILSQRQQDAKALDTINKGDSRIPVEFDEDGEGYLTESKLQPVVKPYEERIQQLEAMLQQSNAAQEAERRAQQIKESIVGEDESFAPAYRRYQAARKWVVDHVTDFIHQNNIGRQLTSGEALDHVFSDKDAAAEFDAAFPGLVLDDIVTAEDSQRHFRRTLSNMAKTMQSSDRNNLPEGNLDSRFRQVLKKPSGLGNQANAKAGQLSVAERMANISPSDYLNLTDAQAEALMRAIQAEEKEEGVRF